MENHVTLFWKREQKNWNCAIITCNKGQKSCIYFVTNVLIGARVWLLMEYLHESLSACIHEYLRGIIIVLLYDTDCIWINCNLCQFLASQSLSLTPLFPREMWKNHIPLGNCDFRRDREAWFCWIFFHQRRNKCLIHREPCFLPALNFVCFSCKLWKDRFITLETWSRHPPPDYHPRLVSFEPVSHLADWRSFYSLCIYNFYNSLIIYRRYLLHVFQTSHPQTIRKV